MKEIATFMWTDHDGRFQQTVSIHGGGVQTLSMDEATFDRQLARMLELRAKRARKLALVSDGGAIADTAYTEGESV